MLRTKLPARPRTLFCAMAIELYAFLHEMYFPSVLQRECPKWGIATILCVAWSLAEGRRRANANKLDAPWTAWTPPALS